MMNTNEFVRANTLSAGANGTMTENGAISYFTLGSEFLDQFGKAASYRGRDINTVWAEQEAIWAENAENALRFPFYLRMITRQTNLRDGEKTEKVQRGAGARDEAFKRLLWIAKYHPEEFYRNLWVLPIVGSWKDLWVLLAFDGASEYLKEEEFFKVIAEGINDENSKDLVKKYLPRIRSNSKCTTDWAKRTNAIAKRFAAAAGWSYEDYREFKSTGRAHNFQRIICSGLYDHINWNEIPGKALLSLVSGKFLDRRGLNDSYINWIKSQPVAKFNGYVFELGRQVNARYGRHCSLATKCTVDKQFDGLIQTASQNGGAIEGNVLCGLDVSASMTWSTLDKSGTMPYDVCLSLGVYFAELNKGAFHNVVADFSDHSTLRVIPDGTFSERYNYLQTHCDGWGSTNFQSLVDLLVDTRKKRPEIAESEFPTTLLVVSDMQFNPTHGNEKSNYEAAMEKIRGAFSEEFVKNFKIVWWYCTNRETSDFPSTMEDSGTYMLSGFDGAIISFVLGGDAPKGSDNKKAPSMEDVANAALSQEALLLVR